MKIKRLKARFTIVFCPKTAKIKHTKNTKNDTIFFRETLYKRGGLMYNIR